MKETLGFELKRSPSFLCSLSLLRLLFIWHGWCTMLEAFIASPASKVGLPITSTKPGRRLQSTSQDLLAVNSSLVMSPKKFLAQQWCSSFSSYDQGWGRWECTDASRGAWFLWWFYPCTLVNPQGTKQNSISFFLQAHLCQRDSMQLHFSAVT